MRAAALLRIRIAESKSYLPILSAFDKMHIKVMSDGRQVLGVIEPAVTVVGTNTLMNAKAFFRCSRVGVAGAMVGAGLLLAGLPEASASMRVTGWGDNSIGQCTPPSDLTNAVAVAAGL